MDRNEDTREDLSVETRLKKIEDGLAELARNHLSMKQFCKLLEQDNSMALHSVHALAEIREIKLRLGAYIEQRGELLKTFDILKG
jgi:hypothetical protein